MIHKSQRICRHSHLLPSIQLLMFKICIFHSVCYCLNSRQENTRTHTRAAPQHRAVGKKTHVHRHAVLHHPARTIHSIYQRHSPKYTTAIIGVPRYQQSI